MKAIIGKQYRHYKGKIYTVLAIARSESDSSAELVIYRAEYDSPDYGNQCVWARERNNWEGKVIVDDVEHGRFTVLSSDT